MFIHSSHWHYAAVRRSPRKIEKKPIYVINISIAPEDVDNCIDPTKSVVHLRVSNSSAHLIYAGKLNAIGQNKNSLVSFLSSILEGFLVKNGFSFPKEPIVLRPDNSPFSPQKRKKLERYQFDDSGYAEPTSIGKTSAWSLDEHHMLVSDSSTTFYASPVGPHIFS